MRFIVFRHAYYEGLGFIADWIEKIGGIYFYVDTFSTQNPPPAMAINYDGLILMGGPQSVNELNQYPELKKSFLAAELFLKTQKPILGVCLGAQILAKVLGGQVEKSAFEFGFHKVKVLEDNLTHGLPQELEVFQWHGENFSLPEKAQALFIGDVVKNQGFAYENAMALQFHLELNEGIYLAWQQVLEQQGKVHLTKDLPPLNEAKRKIKEMQANLFLLLNNWFYPARRNLSGT